MIALLKLQLYGRRFAQRRRPFPVSFRPALLWLQPKLSIIAPSDQCRIAILTVAFKQTLCSNREPHPAVARLEHLPIGVVTFTSVLFLTAIGELRLDDIFAGQFPIASIDHALGQTGIVIDIHLAAVAAMCFVVKGKACRTSSVTVVRQSPAQRSIFHLPVAWIQRLPLGRMHERIGTVELDDVSLLCGRCGTRKTAECQCRRRSSRRFDEVTSVGFV